MTKDIRDEIIEELVNFCEEQGVEFENNILLAKFAELTQQYKNQQSITWEELVKIATKEYGFEEYGNNIQKDAIRFEEGYLAVFDYGHDCLELTGKEMKPYQILQIIRLLFDEKTEKKVR